MRTFQFMTTALACAGLTACLGGSTTDQSVTGKPGGDTKGPISGAIFTTTVDGSRVDANIYADKSDVYLDGGPGQRAPGTSASLPAGDYYFMVTDPSGKTLLSSDDISCRQFTVSDDGVIVAALRGAGGTCQHATGVDSDHAELGAITVQLMPYDDTPNPGGEYKAWATPVEDYVGDSDAPGTVHGFVHRFSKTDNFKVRKTITPPPPPPPACGDNHVDSGEDCDDGNTTAGDGCSATCTTETPPPPPPPCCGDGTVDSGEECDDGNMTSGDGCSSDCKIEAPPSDCGGVC